MQNNFFFFFFRERLVSSVSWSEILARNHIEAKKDDEGVKSLTYRLQARISGKLKKQFDFRKIKQCMRDAINIFPDLKFQDTPDALICQVFFFFFFFCLIDK